MKRVFIIFAFLYSAFLLTTTIEDSRPAPTVMSGQKLPKETKIVNNTKMTLVLQRGNYQKRILPGGLITLR